MFAFFRSGSNRALISGIYQHIAQASRQPGFYEDFGVPDTLEGRFDVLALHMAIVLRHMRSWPAPANDVTHDLTDYFFEQMDDVLREIGTSDIKVPKRMKGLASVFLSKAGAYDTALQRGSVDDLVEMFTRDIGPDVDSRLLALYALNADHMMNDSCLDLVLRQDLKFPVPSKPAGEF